MYNFSTLLNKVGIEDQVSLHSIFACCSCAKVYTLFTPLFQNHCGCISMQNGNCVFVHIIRMLSCK